MGQRVNYIIVDNNGYNVHYHHWRAYDILSDLYLGENVFLEFVSRCTMHDAILDLPWIEACVVVDKRRKQLSFWPFGGDQDSSLEKYYMNELSHKWAGWRVQLLRNRMYDVEKLLSIDFISKQEFSRPKLWSREEVALDKYAGDWSEALVVIKTGAELFVTKTDYLEDEHIVAFGEEIIPLLEAKEQLELPGEGDRGTSCVIVVDKVAKGLIINRSIVGLLEHYRHRWNGYQLTMGDFGYLDVLALANIDTAGRQLPLEKVKEQFENIVKFRDEYDSSRIYEMLKNEGKNITDVNPNFFSNPTPRKD
jgi:hypothetical protein